MDDNSCLTSASDWIDITNDFDNALETLKLGELVFAKSFGLYEAMSAIELMDPKMDSGMMENRKQQLSFVEMVEQETIKVDNLTCEELIGIMDDTFSSLVTWMDGHSFEQTIFINVYMHDPSLVVDKRLKTFCLVILKIVDFLTQSIQKASVYEEEDYQMKSTHILLDINLNHSKYTSMLKSVEMGIQKQIDDCQDQNEKALLKAILVRFQFTRSFYVMMHLFRKHIDINQPQTSLKEFLESIQNNLRTCLKLTEEWSPTLDFGVKPDQNDFVSQTGRNQSYPTIMGFEPMINQRLMSSSFPRYTRIKSRPESLLYLKNFLLRLCDMFKITEVNRFDDVLRFFHEFSKHRPSCIVSRSMLFLFYLSKPDNVFGETPFVKVVKEYCKQFINPPSLVGDARLSNELKDMMESFFSRSTILYGSVLQIYSNNRVRQREKIAAVFESFSVLIDEAISLDNVCSQHYPESKNFGYYQIWCLRYYMHLQCQFIFSGFELELYSSHEYAYVYFELDYILNYISLMFQKAIDLDDQRLINGAPQKSSSRKAKGKGKTKVSVYDHEVWLNYYHAYATLARAMNLICLAFSIQGKIKGPKQNLNSEKIRYEHRFAPLNMFNIVGYDKYQNQLQTAKNTEPVELYKTASELLLVARNRLDAIKEPSLLSEVQSQLKVVKTNLVVVNLLVSGHDPKGTPEFNFSEGVYFPIIKFSK